MLILQVCEILDALGFVFLPPYILSFDIGFCNLIPFSIDQEETPHLFQGHLIEDKGPYLYRKGGLDSLVVLPLCKLCIS